MPRFSAAWDRAGQQGLKIGRSSAPEATTSGQGRVTDYNQHSRAPLSNNPPQLRAAGGKPGLRPRKQSPPGTARTLTEPNRNAGQRRQPARSVESQSPGRGDPCSGVQRNVLAGVLRAATNSPRVFRDSTEPAPPR